MKLLQIFLHTKLQLVSLPTAADAEHVASYPVKGTRAIGHCTPAEDANLITAVANTPKKE
jgi:anthranilate/para-aminobenzoate synthase component I